MWQDVRYGMRMLLRRPAFTLVAVVTLALGIGANTAIFSVVNTMLLRALPFPEPERLVLVWDDRPQGNWPQLPLSLPNFLDLREQCQSCAGMSAWTPGSFSLSGVAEPEQVQYAVVSSNLFSVLGVRPALGRDFLPEEDRASGSRAVIISHSLWQRRFNSDPQFIGQTVTLDGQQFEVAGVLPAGFRFASFPRETEIWLPFGLDPLKERIYNRNAKELGVIARLRPGVSREQAQAEMVEISRRLEQRHPEFNRGLKLQVAALGEQSVRNLRPALLVLLGAVGFVLLIACANVANLQLARAVSRRREMAIRAALGAGRWRLVRQSLIENALLAVMGGGVGVLLAFWGIDLLALLPFNAPSFFMPYYVPPRQINIDGRVLGFTCLLSLLTSVICGLVPAAHASRADLNEALKEGGGKSPGRRGARRLLVVAEMALALLLLTGAGLLVNSFVRLLRVDPGFDPENVLTFTLSLPKAKYPENRQVTDFYARVLERAATLPGVTAVGAVEFLPLSGVDSSTGIFIEGRPVPPPSERNHAHYRTVTVDYFRAMGMRLRQGRALTERDDQRAPRVAVINETMARKYWPGEDAIGKRVSFDFEAMRFYRDRPPDWDIPGGMRQIVGVVADVKHSNLKAVAVPEMFIPTEQAQRLVREMTVVLRTTSDPLALAGAMRREVAAIDPDQSLSNLSTMSQLLAASVAQPRFSLLAFAVFAAIALVLASVGIYGVMSYSVSERTHEVGVRMALGARPGDVMRLVLGQGLRLALAGVAIGLMAALALTRVLTSLLYGVSATDPATLAMVVVLLTGVALLACYLPARRAARVDPVVALRQE